MNNQNHRDDEYWAQSKGTSKPNGEMQKFIDSLPQVSGVRGFICNPVIEPVKLPSMPTETKPQTMVFRPLLEQGLRLDERGMFEGSKYADHDPILMTADELAACRKNPSLIEGWQG